MENGIKIDKTKIWCDECSSDLIFDILELDKDIDLKVQDILEIIDYVERQTIRKAKIELLKNYRKLIKKKV